MFFKRSEFSPISSPSEPTPWVHLFFSSGGMASRSNLQYNINYYDTGLDGAKAGVHSQVSS